MTIRTSTATHTPQLAYRIPQVAFLTGLSRSSIYRLIGDKELTLIKLGLRSSAVTRDSLITYAKARSLPLPDSF